MVRCKFLPYLIATVVLCVTSIQGERIWETIERLGSDEAPGPLNAFKKYIETVFTTSSGQNSLKQIFDLGRFDVTIFAPTNEAFAQQHQLPETAWRYFSDPKDPNNKEFIKRYLNYHIIFEEKVPGSQESKIIRVDTLPNGIAQPHASSQNNFNLWILKQSTPVGVKYFVNQHEILDGAGVNAEDGRIYMINRILYPMASASDVFNVITTPNSQSNEMKNYGTSKFVELMQKSFNTGALQATLQFDKVTLFVPINRAFSTEFIPADKLNELLVDGHKSADVAGSHIIKDKVLFSSALKAMGVPVKAEVGMITASATADNKVSVNNNNIGGVIVLGDMPFSNGVIHLVDSVMNFTANNAFQSISKNKVELGRLRSYLSEAGNTNVQSALDSPPQQKLTYFCPVDTAWNKIPSYVNIGGNKTALNRALKLQLVRDRVMLIADLKEGMTPEVKSGSTEALKFYKVGNGSSVSTYIEGGNVRARIIRGDIGVTNGILHYIDTVLGVPYLTMKGQINTDTAAFYSYIQDTPVVKLQPSLLEQLDNRGTSYTVFAPSNEAFSKYRETQAGKTILENRLYKANLDVVIKTHIVSNQVIYSNNPGLNDGQTVDLQSMSRRVTVKRNENNEIIVSYGSGSSAVEAKVIRPNVGTTNGVLHIIDKVLSNPENDIGITSGSVSYLKQTSLYLSVCCVLIKLLIL